MNDKDIQQTVQQIKNKLQKKSTGTGVEESLPSPKELYNLKTTNKLYDKLMSDNDDGDDPLSKVIIQEVKKLSNLALIKQFKNLATDGISDNAKENSEIKALRDELSKMQSSFADMMKKAEDEKERQRQKEEQEKFRNEILNTVKSLIPAQPQNAVPEYIETVNKKIDELYKQNEEKQAEKEKEERERERLDLIQQIDTAMATIKGNINALENRISNTTDNRGSKVQSIRDLMQELKEEKHLMEDLGMIRKDVSTSKSEDVLDSALKKVPEITEAVKSIQDVIIGHDDEDDEDAIPQYAPPTSERAPRRAPELHANPLSQDLQVYLKNGKTVTDPEGSGKRIWVDQYGVGPTDENGNYVTVEEVEQIMRLYPDMMRKFRDENRAQYEEELEKRKQQAPPPAPAPQPITEPEPKPEEPQSKPEEPEQTDEEPEQSAEEEGEEDNE